ncbi:papain-like cysteine protease family protein [Bradyrhizobium symbiodeficiens]|uniref:papain-like cysteine protease family protein n=1 Tax=Bradyrhizobium symbiodeficiens TaxID=1404367 RepID=UPI00140FC993|nr:papain-like cysteine protease family protein [Bradyrhizobium symbiodeficiens]QIO98822.1 hypothetical protein HAU86_02920 [Bradyrhizobium symbiodeficiens]
MSSVAEERSQFFNAACEPVQLASINKSNWKQLNFNLQYQEKTNWCWAALAVSVAKSYDASAKYTQCEVANGELNRTDCCEDCQGDPCNVFGYLMSSLYRVQHFEVWHVRRPRKSRRLASQVRHKIEAEIITEINRGRPLCARIAWVGGGAHFVAIYGYAAEAELDAVAVADPWWGLSDMDWIDFPVRYRMGASYTDSYHTSKS